MAAKRKSFICHHCGSEASKTITNYNSQLKRIGHVLCVKCSLARNAANTSKRLLDKYSKQPKNTDIIIHNCIDCGTPRRVQRRTVRDGYTRCKKCAAKLNRAMHKGLYDKLAAQRVGSSDFSKAVSAGMLQIPAEVRSSISIANARKAWRDISYREKMATVRSAQANKISSIQKMLYSFLDDLHVQYFAEGPETKIGYYVFDCLIVAKKKLLIECQGDYWHSLARTERNDRSKFTYISKYFPEYELMYIWEHEFYCKDRVLDRLKLKIGIDIETKEFEFSDLKIAECKFSEVREFLDLYHYLGKDRGGRAFGAYIGTQLIACVVFSPPLRQNTAGQFGLTDCDVRELSRLCIHPLYHKKNFASWFIKRILKLIGCKLVVAYADTTVGHNGGVYRASNFKLHHIVPADYWYVDKDGYVMHKRTLYSKARDLKMTEAEFAESRGYVKKFGGEKLCFVKELL